MKSLIENLNEEEKVKFNTFLLSRELSFRNYLFSELMNFIKDSNLFLEGSFRENGGFVDSQETIGIRKRLGSIEYNIGSKLKSEYYSTRYIKEEKYTTVDSDKRSTISIHFTDTKNSEVGTYGNVSRKPFENLNFNISIPVFNKFFIDKYFFGLRQTKYKLTHERTICLDIFFLKSKDFIIQSYDRLYDITKNECINKKSVVLSEFKDLIESDLPLNNLDINHKKFINKFYDLLMVFLVKEYKEFKKFSNKLPIILNEFDTDNNGILDIIEGGDDYLELLKKYQPKIIKVDSRYIQQFIQVSNYLKQKKQNLQLIFQKLSDSINQNQLDQLVEYLKNEIHIYNLILFNSLQMINSLIENDMITFYDIYERYDKLNMFNSNWENEVSKKLDDINLNLIQLMDELKNVGDRIVNSIDELINVTEKSTKQINSKLESINSTLEIGNLHNLIQSYQTYRINQNTKSLKE